MQAARTTRLSASRWSDLLERRSCLTEFAQEVRRRQVIGITSRPQSNEAVASSSLRPSPPSPLPNELLRIISTHIKTHGPLPLARYIQFCLSHPTLGYYTRLQRQSEDSDTIIGKRGDFITSPEISQVFGELLAIWYITQWQAQGMPSRTRLIELGPGKGTLVDDMLRTFQSIKAFSGTLKEVHLVETSAYFRKIQEEKLKKHAEKGDLTIRWHDRIQDVQKKAQPSDDGMFTMIVAHEFFDALPIHLFEKRPEGFREVFVDIDVASTLPSSADSTSQAQPSIIVPPSSSSRPTQARTGPASSASDVPKLRYVISPSATLPSKIFLSETDPKYKDIQGGTRIEVCPEAWEIAEKCTELVGKSGAGLFIDYGDERFFGNSFRAFKNHQIVDPLLEPGSSDLTSNVNFAFLREALTSGSSSAVAARKLEEFQASAQTGATAPLTSDATITVPSSPTSAEPQPAFVPTLLSQRSFLLSLGLQLRIQTLLKNTPDEKRRENMIKAAERLVEKNEKVHGMGKVFKVMGFVPKKADAMQEVFPFGQELD